MLTEVLVVFIRSAGCSISYAVKSLDQDQASNLKSLAMSFPQFMCSTLRFGSGMGKNPPEGTNEQMDITTIISSLKPLVEYRDGKGRSKSGQIFRIVSSNVLIKGNATTLTALL